MSQPTKEEDDLPTIQRPPSPPPHTTFAARGIHPPTFSAFKPRDYRMNSSIGMTSVAWSCDGKKLAAVGMDYNVRVFQPSHGSMDPRSAAHYTSTTNGSPCDFDHVAWNPTHPELFSTASGRDKKVMFWDARQSRPVTVILSKYAPLTTSWAPDGRSLLYTTQSYTLHFLTLGRETPESPKETWRPLTDVHYTGSRGLFNHAGDGILVCNAAANNLRLCDYPSLTQIGSIAAHVGGTTAIALDPRGTYLATGGVDSVINLFDSTDWICRRTISVCDHTVSDLSFSHDGEYLAISSAGSYIDIVATETGLPMHRVPTLGPCPSVAWHPSRYVVAYCGLSKSREGGPLPCAVLSTFGMLE